MWFEILEYCSSYEQYLFFFVQISKYPYHYSFFFLWLNFFFFFDLKFNEWQMRLWYLGKVEYGSGGCVEMLLCYVLCRSAGGLGKVGYGSGGCVEMLCYVLYRSGGGLGKREDVRNCEGRDGPL